ncbi:MAG TPA: phosphatidate cytidylyltransferase [Actinomycetota bacterium]|nr:phosphatidate cytidylyltransferase [Actinomycetota bacterium]
MRAGGGSGWPTPGSAPARKRSSLGRWFGSAPPAARTPEGDSATGGSADRTPRPRPKRGRRTDPPGEKPAGKGSDLKLRILTGAVLAAVVIGVGSLGTAPLLGLLVVVVGVAQGEFYLAVRGAGYQPATALGLVAGATLLVAAYERGMAAAPVVLILTLALGVVWHAWGRDKGRALADLAVTLVGVAYVPLLASFAAAALPHHDGRGIVAATIGAAAVYDIFAYAGGRLFGTHPLAPRISPKKTREGAIVATASVIVLSGAIAPQVGPWSIGAAVLLGALVAVAAPMGDLFESVLKRDLGIKDMGSILPGHGGVLDRIDAILFCVPVAYLSLRIFGKL